jgi:hypothetical protein
VLARKNNEEWNEETAEKYAKDVRDFFIFFPISFILHFLFIFRNK